MVTSPYDKVQTNKQTHILLYRKKHTWSSFEHVTVYKCTWVSFALSNDVLRCHLVPNRGPPSVPNTTGIQHQKEQVGSIVLNFYWTEKVYKSKVSSGKWTNSSEQHLVFKATNSSFLECVLWIYAWTEKVFCLTFVQERKNC